MHICLQTQEAWQAATAWVKQQQQQQVDPADTFQLLLTQRLANWAPLAAVLQAAGPQLGLTHLQQLTEALHTLLERSGSSSGSSSSTGAAGIGTGDGPAADMFVPDVMVLNVPSRLLQQQQQQQQERQQVSSDAWSCTAGISSSSGSTGHTQVVLECRTLLPQLCQLLLVQLQPAEQQQQQPEEQTAAAQLDSASSTSSAAPNASIQLGSSAAVRLLQQLAALHSSGSVGPADPQLVAVLVDQHIQLQDCTLQGEGPAKPAGHACSSAANIPICSGCNTPAQWAG